MQSARVAHAHSDWALHVATDAAGSTFASTSLAHTALVSRRGRTQTVSLPDGGLQCALAETGVLAVAVRDGTVRTYDADGKESSSQKRSGCRGAAGVGLSQDGSVSFSCFTGGAAHALVLRNGRTGEEEARQASGRGGGVRISGDGSRVGFVSEGRATLANSSFRELAGVDANGDAGLAIAGGGRVMAVADADALRIVDARGGRVRVLDGYEPPGRYGRCAMAYDGARVVAAERGGFGVWDGAGRKIAKLDTDGASFNNGCAVSAAGDTVVTAASDGKVRLWGAVTGVGRFVRERETGGNALMWRRSCRVRQEMAT